MDIAIEGMHSPACVRRVRLALEGIEDLRVLEVTLGLAIVSGDPPAQAKALEAVEKAGFRPHIAA